MLLPPILPDYQDHLLSFTVHNPKRKLTTESSLPMMRTSTLPFVFLFIG